MCLQWPCFDLCTCTCIYNINHTWHIKYAVKPSPFPTFPARPTSGPLFVVTATATAATSRSSSGWPPVTTVASLPMLYIYIESIINLQLNCPKVGFKPAVSALPKLVCGLTVCCVPNKSTKLPTWLSWNLGTQGTQSATSSCSVHLENEDLQFIF